MQTSRRRQPQRIPPPITHGDHSLDAEVVLRELPGDLALLVWKTVRTVVLWVELPEAERPGAFAPEALARRQAALREPGVPAEIRDDLEAAAAVLSGDADPAEVAEACRRLAAWADARGASGAALELLQAAALARPAEAMLAHDTARAARGRAEYARAETWYRKAIHTARRTRDHEARVRSHCGLGITFVLRGAYPSARQAFLRGLRAARRHSLHHLAGMLYHHLAAVAIRTGQKRAEVDRYAQAALEAYGPGHPRLPALAHDLAVFWMNRGYFAAALPVFQAIPAAFGEPADRLSRASSIARAAGAAGERAAFEAGWREAAALLEDPYTAERAATALVDLARGAQALGEWERAEQSAARAVEMAAARGEGEQRLEAESVLEAVRRSRGAAAESAPGRAPKPVRRLAARLVAEMPAGAGAA